jgi:hypothetical protein
MRCQVSCVTVAASGYATGETTAKKVTRLQLDDRGLMEVRKSVAMVALSDEVIKNSTPAPFALIGDSLKAGVGLATDLDFLNGIIDAVGSTAAIASSGTSGEALLHDLAVGRLLLWFRSSLGRTHMQIRKLAYATFVAVTAVALVIGSAVPSEAAKKKKKAAAAAPAPATQQAQPPTCWGAPYAPVCAKKGDLSFNYINACYATKDGAKDAKLGPCKEAKAGGKKKKGA